MLIVGAGLSGIGAAACHIERLCPARSCRILATRDRMGGIRQRRARDAHRLMRIPADVTRNSEHERARSEEELELQLLAPRAAAAGRS